MADPKPNRFLDVKQIQNGYLLTIDIDPDNSYRSKLPQYTFATLEETLKFISDYFTHVRINVSQGT